MEERRTNHDGNDQVANGHHDRAKQDGRPSTDLVQTPESRADADQLNNVDDT